MSRIFKPVSMNDSKPMLENTHQSHYTCSDELELQTMVRQAVVAGEEEYVNVTAPTNLPAGYELIVDIKDGSFWTVQVPDEGATMNKTFRGKVLHKTHVSKAELVSNSDPLMNSKNPSKRLQFDIPTGRWRDGILDFCIIPFHPLFFLTYCWPMVALGQVMTRIKFNICGGLNSRTNRNCPSAFYIMLTVTIVNIIFQMFFSGIGQTIYLMFTFYSTMLGGGSLNAASAYYPSATFPGDSSGGDGMTFSDDQFAALFNSTSFDDDAFQKMMTSQISSQSSGIDEPSYFLGMGLFQMLVMISLYIFIMVVHTKTRNQIRRAYSIGNNMSCLGDCCCATWCGVCSICQMARHTANYHTTHRARCCTTTGLDEEWEDHDFLSVDQSAQSAPRSTSPMMV